MHIVSYNCRYLKTSQLLVKSLVNTHDIVFLCEHWLAAEESHTVRQLINTNHNLIFLSDHSLADRRAGRPHGGLLWLLDKRLTVSSHVQVSDRILKLVLTCSDHNNTQQTLFVFGVWLPYDDSTPAAVDNHWNNLTLLAEAIRQCRMDGTSFVLIGDWNCDVNRLKRFDKMFVSFIQETGLQVAGGLGNTPTYKNGEYTARLDYILMSECIAADVTNFVVVDDARNTSDHKPLSISIQTRYDTTSNSSQQQSSTARQAIHRFKWKDPVFVQQYRQELESVLLESGVHKIISNHQLDTSVAEARINSMYSTLAFLHQTRP